MLAHPNLPGMAYRDWDVHAYDGIEVFNGTLPPYSGVFDVLQGRRKWYDVLTKPQRPVAVGGSDNHDVTAAPLRQALSEPAGAAKKHSRVALLLRALEPEVALPFARRAGFVGAVRTYVHCRDLAPDAILAGLRSGATFVTTGPLLLATVDGQLPGAALQLGGKATVTVAVQAASNAGLERIDVIADGERAQSVAVARAARVRETLEVPVAGRTWLVVECYGVWPEVAITNAWRLQP